MQSFYYFSPTTPGNPSWTVDLGQDAVRLGEIPGFVDCAELMTVGMSSIQIDDPLGTVGYNGNTIVGLKQFYVDESAVPGYARMYTGYIADRRYSRGSGGRFNTGVERLIDAALLDVNALASFRIFQPETLDATSSFNRPAETAGERLAALLLVDFVSTTIYDEGLVDFTDTTPMSANDYTWQRPVDVILDVCQQTGRNAFIYYDSPSGHDALFYHLNDDAVYPATANISNVLSDLSSTVFAANDDWVLTRDPSRVVAGYGLSWRGGNSYESNLTTSYNFGYRDGYAAAGDIGDATIASARATRYLTENSTEDDRLAGTVLVPIANIQDIKAGQYLNARFSHLPGYESGQNCRVLRREVAQIERTDQYYTVRYELTPITLPVICNAFDALGNPITNTPTGFYAPLLATAPTSRADGLILYLRPGLSYPTLPYPSFGGAWGFPEYNSGGVDYAGDCTLSSARCFAVGAGTMVIHTAPYSGVSRALSWALRTSAAVLVSSGSGVAGDDFTIAIPDDGNCVHYVEIGDTGAACGSKWGFVGFDWTRA